MARCSERLLGRFLISTTLPLPFLFLFFTCRSCVGVQGAQNTESGNFRTTRLTCPHAAADTGSEEEGLGLGGPFAKIEN